MVQHSAINDEGSALFNLWPYQRDRRNMFIIPELLNRFTVINQPTNQPRE